MKKKILFFVILIIGTSFTFVLVLRHESSSETNSIVILDPIETNKPIQIDLNPVSRDESSSTKVFCLIKSYLKNFRINKTANIYRVWGRKCDDYRFIMLIPEALRTREWKLGEENEVLSPFKMLQPRTVVSESHENVTMKIYHAFMSVYKRFPNYPWYYLVDDDAYANLNNLREFLATQDSTQLVTYGYDFKVQLY